MLLNLTLSDITSIQFICRAPFHSNYKNRGFSIDVIHYLEYFLQQICIVFREVGSRD
jgi:hypothetical protein